MEVAAMTEIDDLMKTLHESHELDKLLEALKRPAPEGEALFEELRRQPHDSRVCPWCRLLREEHEEAS